MTADALAQLQRLRGVTWEWREDAPAEARRRPGMGVIAQEVRAVFPDLVEETDDGLLRVDYDGLVAPLLQAVDTLDGRLRAQEEAMASATEHVNVAVHTSLDVDAIGRAFPQLVIGGEGGEPEIAYEGLIGLLIEAVKELDRRVAALERGASDRQD